MSIIETTSDARCKHCKFHDTAPLKKKDGTPSKRYVGHCFFNETPRQQSAKSYACRNFIPYWQPTKKETIETL